MHGEPSAVRRGEKGCFGATAARPFERRTARCRPRRLYPAQKAKLCAQKVANILENAELVSEYRQSSVTKTSTVGLLPDQPQRNSTEPSDRLQQELMTGLGRNTQRNIEMPAVFKAHGILVVRGGCHYVRPNL